MIEKFFDGVVDQTYYQTGNTEKNVILASYSNDFSVEYLKNERYSESGSSVFFAAYDLPYGRVITAYAPFLEVICDAFREYGEGSFDDFLDECGVYSLQKSIFSSYFKTGVCVRREPVLPDEVPYEKGRMTETVAKMLIRLAEIRPIFMVINRFNLVSMGSIDVVLYLLEHPTKNIGIVLGANDTTESSGGGLESWNKLQEALLDNNQIYHLGSSGRSREGEYVMLKNRLDEVEEMYSKVKNCYELLEFEYISDYLLFIERQAREEEIVIPVEWNRQLYVMYAMVSIMTQNYSKALEVISRLKKLKMPEKKDVVDFNNSMLAATCFMYLGRLEDGNKLADEAIKAAERIGEENFVFAAKLIKAQMQMSGWHNIFFCVSDVEIDEELIELLIKYNFRNNLAHIYIYAYDNAPEVVAKAYKSEKLLVNFSRGVDMAKEIGNDNLVYNAYQKNIMIAATYGMNEIALLYTVRTYQYIKDTDMLERARTFVGIGYNLSALGHNKLAENYYNRALEMYYELRKAEDIAEVNYNKSLNYIMMGEFSNAETALNLTMKTVEKLHLNSIRVCNLSKLYALLAVVSILQGHRFDCERNLQNCRLFLNYIIQNDNMDEKQKLINDYDKSDDELFLFFYATALINYYDGERDQAYENFQEAERYLSRSEGNQFYMYECFRRSRMLLFSSMDKSELWAKEEADLNQYMQVQATVKESTSLDILDSIHMDMYNGPCCVSKKELALLLRQAAIERNFNITKKQMDFMTTWQNIIDLKEGQEVSLVADAIVSLLTYFDNDKAMFIRFEDEGPKLVFNNTGANPTEEEIMEIFQSMEGYPNGFAVSKISENFFDHEKEISLFGVDDVCSFAAVPCYTDGQIQAIFITYILMKDNWHSSVNRYMLNNDDLSFYRLIFKELNNAINLHNATRILEESAHMDMLTGLYNRVGMYREAERLERRVEEKEDKGISVMFLDVDNFKPYNDTFGHDIGDHVLREMAKIFKNAVGDDGFVCRYGGDEFIIIMDSSNHDKLENLAKGILERVANYPDFCEIMSKKPGMKALSCSIGITTNGGDLKHSVDDLIKEADDLMYKVKTGSKGTYTFL